MVFSLWFWFAFPYNYRSWASFQVLIGNLYIFFREKSAEVLCPFSKLGNVFFIILHCKDYLYTLDTNSLSDMTWKSLLSFCALYFTFFMVSFGTHKFLILMKSSLPFIICVCLMPLVLYLSFIMPNPRSLRYNLFSSKKLIIFALTFRLLIDFELIFLSSVR